MQRLKLVFALLMVPVIWTLGARGACVTTCICKDCFQVDSAQGAIHYTVVDMTYATCCKNFWHDTDQGRTESTPVNVDVQQVVDSTPYCNNWGGQTRRTAHSCGALKDGSNPVPMTCAVACILTTP